MAQQVWKPLPLGKQVNDLVRMVDGAPDKNDAWLLWGHISEPNPKATLLPENIRLCELVPADAPDALTVQMTAERIEAINALVDITSRPIYTNKEGAEYMAKQVEIVREMLTELEATE